MSIGTGEVTTEITDNDAVVFNIAQTTPSIPEGGAANTYSVSTTGNEIGRASCREKV